MQERKRKRKKKRGKKKKKKKEEDEGKVERECGSVIKYNFFFFSFFATVHNYRWLCTVARS